MARNIQRDSRVHFLHIKKKLVHSYNTCSGISLSKDVNVLAIIWAYFWSSNTRRILVWFVITESSPLSSNIHYSEMEKVMFIMISHKYNKQWNWAMPQDCAWIRQNYEKCFRPTSIQIHTVFIACTVIVYVPVHPGKLSTFIICIYSQALLHPQVYNPYGLLYVIKNAELLQ